MATTGLVDHRSPYAVQPPCATVECTRLTAQLKRPIERLLHVATADRQCACQGTGACASAWYVAKLKSLREGADGTSLKPEEDATPWKDEAGRGSLMARGSRHSDRSHQPHRGNSRRKMNCGFKGLLTSKKRSPQVVFNSTHIAKGKKVGAKRQTRPRHGTGEHAQQLLAPPAASPIIPSRSALGGWVGKRTRLNQPRIDLLILQRHLTRDAACTQQWWIRSSMRDTKYISQSLALRQSHMFLTPDGRNLLSSPA